MADCCNVCVETFNKSTRKEIPCATCDFKLCLSCFEQYQHDHSGMYEVSCMNCKQLWEDQYVRETIPASVVKRLTGSTKKCLRDSEVAYMPETQMYVEYGKGIETVKTKEYLDCVRDMNDYALKIAEEDLPGIFNLQSSNDRGLFINRRRVYKLDLCQLE